MIIKKGNEEALEQKSCQVESEHNDTVSTTPCSGGTTNVIFNMREILLLTCPKICMSLCLPVNSRII